MVETSANPLIESWRHPPFSSIRPEHVVPAIESLLARNRAEIAALLPGDPDPTWDALVRPIEEMDDRLNQAWSPATHLHAVADTPALREAYNACLPLLSDYATEIGQNARLCAAYERLAASPAFPGLDRAQRRIVEEALIDFRLSGVELPGPDRARFREVASRLSELCGRFADNVLDATQAWRKHVTDPAALAGLPETALAVAAGAAARDGLDGWLLTLDFPCYHAVVTHADDGALRREIYEAWSTRASERGPHAGRWDNGAIMREILALRREKARLLGYPSYAALSLVKKMAPAPDDVVAFLDDLARRARPKAERELADLEAYARTCDGHERLEAWDVAYYSEKLKQSRFHLSREELRPWFPVERVLAGLFEIVRRLYAIRIAPAPGPADVWHPDVRLYEIHGEGGELRGEFYLDLYARPDKRGGAWMDECRVRRRTADGVQTPIAYLTCNFSPPVEGRSSLLTHDEVLTLFHEFGHGLHHMLTRVDHPSVSGINGVEWDAIELPSQLMENWGWEREALALFAAHHETGAPLPDELYERLRASRNFQSGLQMLRQIELAIFDFRLHLDHDPEGDRSVQDLLEEVHGRIALLPLPEFNRFAHAFGHIFSGGYAAGYYSYKWAEVLSSDAFSAFEEHGIFDRATGFAFLHSVLEQGGSRPAMESFVEFRGRAPRIDALLRHSGMVDAPEAVGSAA